MKPNLKAQRIRIQSGTVRSHYRLVFSLFVLILICLFTGLMNFSVAQDNQSSDTLSVLAKRCRYYYIRSRAGDSRATYLLISKNEGKNTLTGLEKCLNVLNEYLVSDSITNDEKKVYQQVYDHLFILKDKLPKDEETNNPNNQQ
ncbi:hypothetical protein [Cyanobacterium aponinum]|uniref:Uncharacterized protein n=1 Tax=Cyanobacterium aponinum (strain PCC 10605) TaxID=755178 RepID=K9Z5A0_CYAAP|nr:hypothetical protein [Cyanobacterium aponinum]AFZ54319.1 hypothetical protein Cyan10605_2233 [Cyanobacterium aponinum PCC 10605]